MKQFSGNYPNVNWNTYTQRVLKKVHPHSGISGNSKDQLNDFLNVVGSKITESAIHFLNSSGKQTLSSRDIQAGVRFVIPGELAKHAVTEATKSHTKYYSFKKSRAERAGLIFSPARAENLIRSIWKGRVGGGSGLYLAAVLEYLASEILELSGNCAIDQKVMRITPRCLFLATATDGELTKLLKNINFKFTGGVMPAIHAAFVPGRT